VSLQAWRNGRDGALYTEQNVVKICIGLFVQAMNAETSSKAGKTSF